MVRLIIWAILLLVIVRLVWRFMYALFDGAGMLKGPSQAGDRGAVKLVRDPVCGVFVVPGKALTSGSGTSTRYFCSEKCREQWGRR
jgi:YHS domain-containing protein